jgi:ABC-type multidrug transport system fused ATPase/permease subunit
MGGPVTVIILTLIGGDPYEPKQNLVDIANILSWILRFHPCFCLGHALYFALNIDFVKFLYPGLTTVWSKEVLLYDVIWSTNPSIVSAWKKFTWCLTCSWPKSSDRDITTELAEDSDVLAEEERVGSGGANNDIIVCDKLSKTYDNGKKAVNNLSLGIPPGQVFGLLGVNGA